MSSSVKPEDATPHDPQMQPREDQAPRPKAPAYARDLVGYGRSPPNPKWPGGARVAVQFVINYEEVRHDLQS